MPFLFCLVFVASLALHWASRRWWVSLSIPVVCVTAFIAFGAYASPGDTTDADRPIAILFVATVALVIASSGALTARSMRTAQDKKNRVGPYADQWRRYVWWRRANNANILIAFVVWPLIAYAFKLSDFVERIVFFPLLFCIILTNAPIAGFECPRCNRWFFGTWKGGQFFTRKCIHCGLKIYEGA